LINNWLIYRDKPLQNIVLEPKIIIKND